MNIKISRDSQLSTTESKKQTKQTTRTGAESQMWRPFGELSVWREQREHRGKGAEIRKHKLVGTKQTGGG